MAGKKTITLDVRSASSQILLGGNEEKGGMMLDPDWLDTQMGGGDREAGGGGSRIENREFIS